ncbi:hypothetical protein [Robinsoniella peoriensis]|uniref:hypothetical protein n=1 Tax=Robinsoniella peoriensis TaxID=180332 RepID=UPI0037501C94
MESWRDPFFGFAPGGISWNYQSVIGFNLGLIVLGVTGVLAPATSALLHNTSTLLISLKSMTNALE